MPAFVNESGSRSVCVNKYPTTDMVGAGVIHPYRRVNQERKLLHPNIDVRSYPPPQKKKLMEQA